MKWLVVAATEKEIVPIQERLSGLTLEADIDFLVTGVGMVSATHSLTRVLTKIRYDKALQIGIAGTLADRLPLRSVAAVSEDHFIELGAEDNGQFLSLSDMGLSGIDRVRPSLGLHRDLPVGIHWAKGITVNRVHGERLSIDRLITMTDAALESMEGAAFYYVCNQENIPCLQLRGISNRVEPRNRDSWDIPGAVEAVTNAAFQVLITF